MNWILLPDVTFWRPLRNRIYWRVVCQLTDFMLRATLAILTILFLASCGDKAIKQHDTKINSSKKDFGDFTLEIPDNWKEIKDDGPDFSFQTYVSSDKDTFGLYVGRFAH